MSMTENEAIREMTFDEEYEILQAEKNELFSKENDSEEPPFANCVVRRALRCIRKLKEERGQYRAIGTVSEFRELKEKATAKKAIPLYKDGEYHECPTCGYGAENHLGCRYRYCPSCGTEFDLSEGKE